MESAVAAPSHNRHDQDSNEKSENKGEEVHSVATSRCELCQEILGKNPKHLTEAVKGNFLKMIKVPGVPNDGFLPNALKRCFRLSGVLLKLCRLF